MDEKALAEYQRKAREEVGRPYRYGQVRCEVCGDPDCSGWVGVYPPWSWLLYGPDSLASGYGCGEPGAGIATNREASGC